MKIPNPRSRQIVGEVLSNFRSRNFKPIRIIILQDRKF